MTDHLAEEKQIDEKMKLWQSVREVPDKYRKEFSLGGRAMTAIDPCYLVRLATETWGPCGTGWGYTIVEDEIIGEKQERLHTMEIYLWYMSEDEQHYVTGVGCTPLYMQTRNGLRIDSDFNKKTLTDAIGNALWRLGFGADVRMGMQDENKYGDPMKSPESVVEAEKQKAWDELIAYRVVAEGLRGGDKAALKVISEGTTMLMDNNRLITASTIRELISHLRDEAEKRPPGTPPGTRPAQEVFDEIENKPT